MQNQGAFNFIFEKEITVASEIEFFSFRIADIITVTGLIGAMYSAFTVVRKTGKDNAVQTMLLEQSVKRLDDMEKDVRSIATVITELAHQKESIERLMRWYDELRRGIGKIDA